MSIDPFEREVRKRLNVSSPESKIYLKQNYGYEIFIRHGIQDYEIDFLFDAKRIMRIYPHLAFADRIEAEINAGKNRIIKVIFCFDPVVNGCKLLGKIGIITAFKI